MLPDGTSEEQVTALRRDLASIEGGISLVETEAAGHGQGIRSAPQVDWQLRRFGANVPESNVALRSDVSHDVLAALGIPAPAVSRNGRCVGKRGLSPVACIDFATDC